MTRKTKGGTAKAPKTKDTRNFSAAASNTNTSSVGEDQRLDQPKLEIESSDVIVEIAHSMANIVHAPPETDKTGETGAIDNYTFLRTVHEVVEVDALPIVVTVFGNPNAALAAAWSGRPWRGDKGPPSNANNYFSLARFRQDEQGKYRRRKIQFDALCAIMLDDVGTKVSQDWLSLPPSWLLETSPGNYQAGYILREPLTDGKLADRLMNGIIRAKLCDPGAGGPCARLARLPMAVNGKHTPPFTCRLEQWAPELKYSVDELVTEFQLDLVKPARSKQAKQKQKNAGTTNPEENVSEWQDGDAVFLPRPEENAILARLRERSLYKVPLGDGKHDITCPWVSEHTGGVDGGTVYFEPSNNWQIGGFKCLHGHCAHRRIRELLAELKVETSEARMTPTIRIVAGELDPIVDAAERELALTARHYQRGGLIVTVTTDPGTCETSIRTISQPALVRVLAGIATWERFSKRYNEWNRSDPPSWHVRVLYEATNYPHLPVLQALARQPYLRPDGSLIMTAGYDSLTCMFGVFDAREFKISENPTRAEAEAALAVLQGLLVEFSFAAEADFSAALTAILTASIRPSLPTAPMFHVRAHMVGSGKSYLCELITAFATPQRGTPTAFPGDDEECRKLLLADLLRAPAVIEFDNLTGDLVAHKSLCTALTSEHMSGRILGVSKTASVTTRTLFLSSGNNVGPVQDMTRRCITVRLSPQVETPAGRTFERPNLIRDVLHERGRFVSAALTIIRAWIFAGRPRTPCKELASYGDWSDLCRQPLMWLGCADPTTSVFEAMSEDPDRETLARLLDSWFCVFGKKDAMVRDVVKQALNAYQDENRELLEVLRDIADERGEINRRKLGWWIRRHSGRIVNGRRIVRAAGNGSAERWRIDVVLVSPVSEVPSTPPWKTGGAS